MRRAMPTRHAIEFDVTASAGLRIPTHIAATLFEPQRHGNILGAVVLVPGGGFTRSYYDLELGGYHDYSAAMQLAQHGWIVVAIDNLGTGESTIPVDGNEVTLDRCASALADVVSQLRSRLSNRSLRSAGCDIPIPVVAIGHSLGGCIVTLMQGDHVCCDAVGILGYSCKYIVGAVDRETGKRLRAREYTGNGYNRTTPATQRERFYSEKVPLAIIEAEEAARVPMPNGVAEALIPGRTASAAGRIQVPVLLAFGDRDVSPDRYGEPAFYRRSNDVTLLTLTDAGHAHNSAPGRVAFWDRIVNWMESVTIR